MTSVFDRIKQYNSDRNPDLAHLKYQRMQQNAFKFYRGSCHLFYEDLARLTSKTIMQSPSSWLCGDLHLENFGSYKASNRQLFFDMNDFDESLLGPCLLDVTRLTTSLLLTEDFTGDQNNTRQLVKRFLTSYADTLQQGLVKSIDINTSKGLFKDFLETCAKRKRSEFIASRTEKDDGKLKLIANDKQCPKIDREHKEQVLAAFNQWAEAQEDAEFYKVLDVQWRLAGTGSLGLSRYVFLVHGKGKEDHYLLDMKLTKPSSAIPYVATAQPHWQNEAERVIQSQQWLLSAAPALLNKLNFAGQWYLLKELQPTADKLDLESMRSKELPETVETLAQITAWAQLRSSGRQGSASADQLMVFAGNSQDWQETVFAYSVEYAVLMQEYFQQFKTAYTAEFGED